MKTFVLSLSLCMTLALTLGSCTEKEVLVAEVTELNPQFSGGGCNDGLCQFNTGNWNMLTWMPYLENALNGCHKESPSGPMVCTSTSGIQTSTKTDCFPTENQYGFTDANDYVCMLRDWARLNRPASSANLNPMGITRWYLSDYTMEHDPNAECVPHCSNPDPLKLTATYTKYQCNFVIETSHQLEVAKFEIEGPSNDLTGIGDGPVALEMKIREITYTDSEEDGGDDAELRGILIKNPAGDVLQLVQATEHSDPTTELKVFTFEVHGYSLSECTFVAQF